MADNKTMFQGLGTYRLDGSPRAVARPRQSTALEDAGAALIEQLVAEGMDLYTAREVARRQGLTMLENQPLIRPADLAASGGTALALGDYEQDPGFLTGVGVAASMLGLGLPARLARRGIQKAGSALSRGLGSLMPKSDFAKALEKATTTTGMTDDLFELAGEEVLDNPVSDLSVPETITSWVVSPSKTGRENVVNRLAQDPSVKTRSLSALDDMGYGDTVPVFRLLNTTTEKLEGEKLISGTVKPEQLSASIRYMTEGKFSPLKEGGGDFILVRYDVPRDKVQAYLPAFKGDIKSGVNKKVKEKGFGQDEIEGLKTVSNPSKHAKGLLDLQDEILADVSGLQPTILTDSSGRTINPLSGEPRWSSVSDGQAKTAEQFSAQIPSNQFVLNPRAVLTGDVSKADFETAEAAARVQEFDAFNNFFRPSGSKVGKEPVLSDSAREAVVAARAERGSGSRGRAEFADESFLSHSHGDGADLADAVGGEQTGAFTRYKSKLRNALFNEDSFLMGGGDKIKVDKPINSNRVRNSLKRMGVSDNEIQVSGIEDLLKQNKQVSLKQLREASEKFTPRLSVVRSADSAEEMEFKTYQRWTHMPRDTSKATSEYNVVDYEEVLINDNRPGLSGFDGGSTHYGGVKTAGGIEVILDQQGHFRGSVLTEFEDPTMNELFPDGAFLSEEIQTDFDFNLRDAEGQAVAAQSDLSRQQNLGRGRIADMNELFIDNDVTMNDLAQYLPVEFEQGADDFADAARLALFRRQRFAGAADPVLFEDPSDMDRDMMEILDRAVDYVQSDRGVDSEAYDNLVQTLRDTGDYGDDEINSYIRQLNRAPEVSAEVKAFRDETFNIIDSQGDIEAAQSRLDNTGRVIEMTPEKTRIFDEAGAERLRGMKPLDDALATARSFASDARRKVSVLTEDLQSATAIESSLEEKAEALLKRSQESGLPVDQLGLSAMERAENNMVISNYELARKKANTAARALSKAQKELEPLNKKVQEAQKAIDQYEIDFALDNPEFAALRNKQKVPQFVFEDEADFVRFVVDSMIERSRARGLSGVIFPDWRDIRDLRFRAPDSNTPEVEVEAYKKASNKFRAMYNDTIKKRLNEHKSMNPGSRVVSDLPINSTSSDLPASRRKAAEYFNESDEPRKPFGFSFGRARGNRAEIPPASFAKGGLVMKGIGAMGREVL